MATRRRAEAGTVVQASSFCDAIVVGAGHNGLVAAAYLAKAGKKVLVLEKRPIVGGACVTEEVHPGFRVSTLSYTCGLLRPEIKADLDLARFGLEEHAYNPSAFQPFPDKRFLLYRLDAAWNQRQVAKFSKEDAAALPRYDRFWAEFADMIRPTLLAPPVSLADLIGMIQSSEAEDFLRRTMLMSIADFVDDFFESEEVKVSLSASGVAGTMAGPHTPGTAYVLGHQTLAETEGVRGAWGWAKGGQGGITQAMARAAEHFGATIRTDAGVQRIVVKGGRATGVELEDGTSVEAKGILSNADPKRTFLQLVGKDVMPPDFVHGIERYKMDSCAFKLNLALKGLPDFEAIPGTKLQDHHRGIIDLAPSIDYIERAYEDAKHGVPSREPFLECCLQSANDPTVAPQGMHTLTISSKFAPFSLASGTWDTEGERYAERILDTFEAYAPNIREIILAKRWVTPLDMEREYGLTHGDHFHGMILPQQIFSFRPLPGWAQYRTPIEGLYLCGAGAHPGGGVIGAAGHNAAMAVLEDWTKLAAG